MSVFKQLQKARTMFLSADIKKSGKNKFAGYEYFELGDFIPAIHKIFDEVGLCGVVRFSDTVASLTVYDVEDVNHGSVEFTSPMVYAENIKGQAIQNLGSTHTYLRRYLWLMAMEIVEHDSVDSTAPVAATPVVVAPIVTPKAAPKPAPSTAAEAPKPTAMVTMPSGEKIPHDNKLFVDKLIEWAAVQESKTELIGAWKANQKIIDAIKKDEPELFEHLKNCFSDLKAKYEE